MQVLESEKALRHLHSGSRAHSGSGLGRDEALQENGAQDLIRRSLPEGTTFSRSQPVPFASLLHLSVPDQNLRAIQDDARVSLAPMKAVTVSLLFLMKASNS